MGEIYINEKIGAAGERAAPALSSAGFHRRLPGYRQTPLVESPSAAAALGVGRVLVKDESLRLGLPSFKILGASWAVYRKIVEDTGIEEDSWDDIEGLRSQAGDALPDALVTATDGNHGRGVARVARWLGTGAEVFVPEGTSSARIGAIESEGASVEVVKGDYDDAVRRAASLSSVKRWLIQDTAWKGYEKIPMWVVEGYSTIFDEAESQASDAGFKPDLVAVQIGVGSLACAAVMHFRRPGSWCSPMIAGVEPATAACALESVRAGRSVSVPGPHSSVMAGLNCGTVSYIALPYLLEGLDALVSVEDGRALEAMRILAADGIVSGESGAAGLAGLLELFSPGKGRETAVSSILGGVSSVMVISTEGITDPDIYESAVGPSP